MREQVFHIFPVADHGCYAPEDSLFAVIETACEDLLYVNEEGDCERNGSELMKEQDRAKATHGSSHAASPDAVAEAQRQARSCKA